MSLLLQFLTGDERVTRWRISKIMASSSVHELDSVVGFEDSGDEESLDGVGDEGRDGSDSDLDFDGLEDEDDSAGYKHAAMDDDKEAKWTDHLSDIQIPSFTETTGINFILPSDPKHLDFFSAFVDDSLWDLIVSETNRNAHQKLSDSPERLAKFSLVTRAELKAFIAIKIIMGIVRLPNLALYWSSDDFFGNQGIKRIMPKNRFTEINCYLNFNDSTQEPHRGAAGYDRLFKISPIISHVRSKCLQSFRPSQNISVDEGMIAYRGRISFRQYMPAKPTKHGIKVWMAADSSNGYVLNFDIYLGKEAGQQRIHGLGYDVVTKMVLPFMNKNHHVYFDNFFSSVNLLEHLQAQSTFCCATVRSNRKDLPSCAQKKLQVGQKLVYQKDKVVFTKWHDKRDVSLISSNCSPVVGDVVVNRRDQEVTKPGVVDLYNKHMGGVDLADQLRSYYSVARSSKKWYRYIFWYLIDISVCNAFILFNYHQQERGKGKVKQIDFRTSLAKQLLGGFSCSVSKAQPSKRRKIDNFYLDEGNAGKHFIDKIKGRKRQCVYCKKVGKKTPKGNPVESSFECVQCSIALCRTCFYDFHGYYKV